MQKQFTVAPLAGVVVLISMGAACNKEPTRPAPTPNGGTPGIARVEMAGPATFAPGTRVNYKLTGFLTDGTTRDMTAEADWRSSNVAVATIDRSGEATGNSTGDTTISATVFPLTSRKGITVMPAGTFKLVGSILEETSAHHSVRALSFRWPREYGSEPTRRS